MGTLISIPHDIIDNINHFCDTRSDERKYKDSIAGGTSLETISDLMLNGLEHLNKKNINDKFEDWDKL